jgi:hypothetical protein
VRVVEELSEADAIIALRKLDPQPYQSVVIKRRRSSMIKPWRLLEKGNHSAFGT